MPTIKVSDKVTIDFGKQLNQVGSMCQELYISKRAIEK